MTANEAFQLALAHHQAGRLGEAERFYRAAVAADARHAPSWHNLGVILEERGELVDAIDAYRAASAAAPISVESHFNLANALIAAGRPDEAIASFRTAIALAPGRFDIHGDFGTALRLSGRIDEALLEHRRATALRPESAEARANLGLTQLKGGLSDDAIGTLTETLRLKPGLAVARYNLGNALKTQGRIGEAIEAYRRAVDDAPGDAVAHDNLIFAMYHDARCDLAAVRAEERRWAEKFERPLLAAHRPHENGRDAERRLRVAYVSPDFSDHAHAFYILPLLANHDRERVETICYSSVVKPDAVTARIKSHASAWRDVAGLSDERLAELMRSDGIDVAIDLSMHLAGNRLLAFARKPAPVQVTWLAYTAGAGMESIDYRLTDSHLDPVGAERDARYAERSVRLPETFWCYDPIVRDMPVHALPAVTTNGSVTFGCLSNFSKVNGMTLRLWAGVLCAVQRSRMLILCDASSARGRTTEALSALGVDASRIDFVPRQPRPQYLATHHRIDVMLDTFPFNGHTTSFDALWMGVPVVSLCGETSVSRGGLSIMANLGLAEDFVAHDEPAFVKLAAERAGDIDALSRLRTTLRERMESSALMDGARFARALQSALREMWRAWCARGR